ncbi:DNA cytosine methyltransferase (plasmid) [Bacillus glycinifermentans]|uniref:DNA (cytosine-5-)-methyltransferase n=1 Tax=Bacillus glycinifermentans TaxID=1664069 RepID=A0AAJ3Z4W6_9BACI|nr:DNA cytosine methyltransferase [Bacillus glycinifermentans]QAT68077.1 DNA cytosine methyltransferase [Bacillus glycinifermentans]
MLIKKRKAKKSNRGIYLQDSQLNETEFKAGTHFKYIIDTKQKQIVILPSDKKGNTVSKRIYKDSVKPVIDIRKKEALRLFSDADYLEIEIHNDEIIVKGAIENQKDTFGAKLKNLIPFRKKKVLNYKKKLKHKIELRLSKQELNKAVGSEFQQLTIFDVLQDSTNIATDTISNTSHFRKAINNLNVPFQIISLFSGAGVMDQGFIEAGFDIKFALEKDADAVKTYAYNIGQHIEHGDIKTFDFKQFEAIGAPIMVGGPPCQGFSSANRHTNYLDNPNNELIKYYIKAIKANPHCKVFVLENVEEILTAGNGKFKNEILRELSDFEITTGVINSADMGSAQVRRRAIFIGSKIGRIELPTPLIQPGEYKTVREAFKGLNDGIPNQLDITKAKPETIEKMKHVPQGGNWTSIPDHLKTDKMKSGKTHSLIYRRLEYDKPSITITNVRKSNILHPTENRTLSIRECARLFGLKDTFVFKGKLSSMQQQIANAVPVELAKSVASVIRTAIQKFNQRHDSLSPVFI